VVQFLVTQKHAFYKAITGPCHRWGVPKAIQSTNYSYEHVRMGCDLFRNIGPNVPPVNAPNWYDNSNNLLDTAMWHTFRRGAPKFGLKKAHSCSEGTQKAPPTQGGLQIGSQQEKEVHIIRKTIYDLSIK